MGVSLTGLRAAGAGPATVRVLAGAVQRSAPVVLGSGERLAARLGVAELRAPAAAFLLVPLLLGPPAAAAELRDLLLGLLLFFVIDRTVPPLAAAAPGSLRGLPWTSTAAALLAFAAAAAHGSGLLVLVLLVAGCECARVLRRATPVDAACLALGAALRVDAGALLLDGGRGALLPLLVGSGVVLAWLARARGASATTAGPGRAAGRGPLDLVLLGVFSLVLTLALALPAQLGLLGDVPSPWVGLGWPLLAAAGLAVLAAADRPGAAGGRRVGRLVVALAVAWLATFTLAVRLGGSG